MRVKDVVVIGAGKALYDLWPTIYKGYNVVAILDNNIGGEFQSHKVLPVAKIIEFNYDMIFILSLNYMFDLRDQLLALDVPESKVIPYIGENRNLSISDLYFNNNKCNFDNGYIKFELDVNSGNGGIKGIFSENIYNFLGSGSDTIVVDIGVNIGISSIFFASKPNVKKVVGFEPLSEMFNMAQKNVELNIPEIKNKIEIYNIGLSNCDAKKRFNYSRKFPTTFSICGVESVSPEDELIEIRPADEILKPIFNKYSHNQIVVKMDCEGAEYEIFESLDKADLLRNIDILLIEYHLTDNIILEQYLRENGFCFVKTNTASYIGYIYAFNIKKGKV